MIKLTFNAANGNPTPKWIMAVRDLPTDRSPTTYSLATGDKITLGKRDKQVLDALLMAPLFCASTVRISDSVLRLRRDHGLTIDTLTTIEGRKFYQLRTALVAIEVTQ